MSSAGAGLSLAELEAQLAMMKSTAPGYPALLTKIQALKSEESLRMKPRAVGRKPPPPPKPSSKRRGNLIRTKKLRKTAADTSLDISKPELQIPRNILHIVLKAGKWTVLPRRVIQDAPVEFPVTITAVAATGSGAGGAGAGAGASASFTITTSAASSSDTTLTVDPPQNDMFAKSTVKTAQPLDNLDARMESLKLGPIFTALPALDQTTWSKIVLIAGYDPYVAYRILSDGAHDYGSLISSFYTGFLIGVFGRLNTRPGIRPRPVITVGGVLDTLLTSQGDRGGGLNAKPDAIAAVLDGMNRLDGVEMADLLAIDQCLVATGMRNAEGGPDCASVCSLACSFGSSGILPDSITFNLLPYYVIAANENSVRALWAQSLPQFMDAAGTPTEDAVALHGAKFVDLTKATLLSDFQCDTTGMREFGGAGETFTVHNFYGNSKHVFKNIGAAGCTLEIYNEDRLVATIKAKQSISLNGLSNAVTGVTGRGKSKKTKDPIAVEYPPPGNPSEDDMAEVLMAKQLLDWAQAYFIAFLWHNFGLIFTLVTNDTFLLRITKWLRVPFVILMSKNGAKLYCFDSRAMILAEDEKASIFSNIKKFTDRDSQALQDQIISYIDRTFRNDNKGTAVPIIGCVYTKVLELKAKIFATIAEIRASRVVLEGAAVAAAELESIAQKYRYLMKQGVYVYLLTKFKDDMETQFSSASSVTRSINSFIAAYAKQEPPVTLTDTLSSIINLMKMFLPSITPQQIGLWITKLPFPITLTRFDLQQTIMGSLLNRAIGGGFAASILAALKSTAAPFTAATVLAATAPAQAPDPEAVAIADAFRMFAAIDWNLTTSGDPLYPYYYLLPDFVAPDPTICNYGDLTYKQQERVRSLGYTEAECNALVAPQGYSAAVPPQKGLKDLAAAVSTIELVEPVVISVGGRRKERTKQRGGAYNESFRRLTVWDKMNFEYGNIFNNFFEATEDPSHPYLNSVVEEAAGAPTSVAATVFYKIESYLCYCFDYVEENNNDILIADYANMLTTLSGLRVKCFTGELSEEDALIELSYILLVEDDEFPSIYSTVRYNKCFDKVFLYKSIRPLLLPADNIDKVELNAVIDEILPSGGGASAGASAGGGAGGEEPVWPEEMSYEDFIADINRTFQKTYRTAVPGMPILAVIRSMVAMPPSEESAASLPASMPALPSPPIASGGAGAGVGVAAGIPVSKKEKPLSRDQLLLKDAIAALREARTARGTIKPLSGTYTPLKGEEEEYRSQIARAEARIDHISKEVDRLRGIVAGAPAAAGKGAGETFRAGGFRRTRSRIGKKRATRKQKTTASSTGRKTRRRK